MISYFKELIQIRGIFALNNVKGRGNLNLHNTCKINIMEIHKVLKINEKQRNLQDAESIKSLIIRGI